MTNPTEFLHGTTDGTAKPRDILGIQFHAHQMGSYPHLVVHTFRPALAPLDVVLDGSRLVGTVQAFGVVTVMAATDEWVVLADVTAHEASVHVAATTPEQAEGVIDRLRSRARPEDTGELSVAFWRTRMSMPLRSNRTVEITSWDPIRPNYPDAVGSRLDKLMARREIGTDDGRLLLFWGQPGTGKTTAVQALMQAWAPWCETHLITDPEKFLLDAQYVTTVAESAEGRLAPALDGTRPEMPWKLVVLEDVDEFLRASARKDSQAPLGRLLNLTDGVLGRSTRVVFLLTTNEDAGRISPALIRPGRCLDQVEFPRFRRSEAARWLAGSAPAPTGDASLAELFAARRTGERFGTEAVLTGSYL